VTELARGSSTRFTFGPSLSAAAVWSPDGERILFRTNRRGLTDFYVKSAGGGGTEQPALLEDPDGLNSAGLESPTLICPTDWSADGRYVIFSMEAPAPAYNLWLLSVAGDRKPIGFLRATGAMHANFSPDGRLIAYSSNESGRFQVYVQTVPLTDRKWQVSTSGGNEPRWWRDGNELYYVAEDRKLMAVSVDRGPSYGVPKPLFQTRTLAGVFYYRTNYVTTGDGQRFLINTQSDKATPNPITVVLNWNAALGAREKR
jgi:Tol biopolymer transport system component